MARLKAKDYRKELSALERQRKVLENRIVTRAKELCKQHPNVPIAENVQDGKFIRTGEYVDIENLYVITALSLIEIVENHLAKIQPYKQVQIDFPDRECISLKSPDGKHLYENGSKYCTYCHLNKNYF